MLHLRERADLRLVDTGRISIGTPGTGRFGHYSLAAPLRQSRPGIERT
jgi:hypothetical protein